ncbi:mitochondrial intermediate peptidase [Ramaria rubella]|nr:mitochondrial intermediate peptidase [Ramaria rubella]
MFRPCPVFTFKGCLRTKKPHLSSFLATFANVRPASVDDLSLIPLFDHPKPIVSSTTTTTGLFHHPLLHEPTQFTDVAALTISRARRLVDRILRAPPSQSEMLKVVKNLDRLSDMLCNVIDLAELVRNAHPDPLWIENANSAYEMLCEFMNVLNTHAGLSEVLKGVLADRTTVGSLGPEAYQTALIFWRDFIKSGVDLPTQQRERFVSLSSEIIVLGRSFLNEAHTTRPPAILEANDLQGRSLRGLSRLKAKSFGTTLSIYPGTAEAQLIMRSPSEEVARRKLYLSANASTPAQVEVLERLLRARAELSRLVGRESYAHLALEDKMAKSPENVQQFLDTRISHSRSQVMDAVRYIAQLKQAHLQLADPPRVYAWDRDAFMPPARPSPPIALAALTPGKTFCGLSRLFYHLYGISFRPAEILKGEVWHSDVQKLEVLHEDEGVIGWLYVDLFSREGKANGAAHYTVVCSRRTDDDDEHGDFTAEDLENGASVSALRDVLPFNRYTVRGREGTYQLPVAVLMFEISRPRNPREPVYLEWQEVLTLCHEMGHALHSMVGRTEYQNVSGTRCATDFVELPSILMEYFLTSPKVLSLFTEPASDRRVQYPYKDGDTPSSALDSHSQVLLGLIDQIYHSSLPLNPGFDSTTAFAQLQDAQSPIPSVPGTSWQTQFGHLYSYGATYYSYMFDRAIAGRVWQKLFQANPLDRKMGEKFKREVLVHGGGRDPWEMVSNVLDAPELKQGDAEAMKEVGRWELDNDVAAPTMHV